MEAEVSWFHGAQIRDPKTDGSGPGFTRYTTDEFDMLRRQHNIIVLVGNGFDLQVMSDFNRNVDSRYETFYHYLAMSGFDPSNALVRHMGAERRLHEQYGGHENWSDIEAAVAASLKAGTCKTPDLLSDLRSIQAAFAQFLQLVAPSELLEEVGVEASRHQLSHASLSEFLRDITDRDEYLSMRFPRGVSHHDLFNFRFVNFNYTALLDDYVHLDQRQFDPLKNKTVDTNFMFKDDPRTFRNPGGKEDEGQSTYVLTDVVHPHGILSTPRSLLFGIDAEDDYKKHRGEPHRLKKAYWSQAHALYRGHFSQADLFIIFGCSLGESDGWWWRNIAKALQQRKVQEVPIGPNGKFETVTEQSELIIYWWKRGDADTIDSAKERFFDAAGIFVGDPARNDLSDCIHVVLYDAATPRTFLRTRALETP